MPVIHNNNRNFGFTNNPDNFVGVEVVTRYSIGPTAVQSALSIAKSSSRRSIETEIKRLSSYFVNPKVERSETRYEIKEETNSREHITYVLYGYTMIEITEEMK